MRKTSENFCLKVSYGELGSLNLLILFGGNQLSGQP